MKNVLFKRILTIFHNGLLYFGVFHLIQTTAATNATISQVTANKGSLNGETRLTIDGTGFSTDQYSAGNTVKLVSSTLVYDCPVHKDGTTEIQIMCYTPQGMIAGDYYVRVSVDGEDVPLQSHCNGNPTSSKCKFTATMSSTPTITQIEPITQSGTPGGILKLYGKIYSGIYGSNIPSDEVSNGVTERILRVYAVAQLCELRGENDTFYGIQLDNEGTSQYGYMKCLMKGTFIGNTNESFILEGEYGRSMPNADLLRVASNDQIYMFQTYATVTGVSPSTGSVKGGTTLTVSGQYFDETRSPVRVMIGGTECVKTKAITDGVIECKTAAEMSAPKYSGNRGLNYEHFNETSYNFASLANIQNLFTNASDYSSSIIDHFYVTEDNWDGYSTRIHGYFVPPHSGEYTLHIKSDDRAILYFSMDENPANKVQVASCRGATSKWNKYSEQTSNRLTLQKNKHYYIEAIHSEDSVSSFVRVAARHLGTTFINKMTGLAVQERQKIKIGSTVVREVQTVTVSNLNSGTKTSEVQEVTIEENSGAISDATYQLGLYGVYTTPLQTITDATEIENALSKLSFFDSTESVSVTSTTLSSGAPGAKLTVTFNSERGDFPALSVQTSRGTGGETLTVSVSQKTAGVPSGNYFTITMESVPSPLIPAAATANQVQTALEVLFGTRCPSFLTNPTAKKHFYNFESSIPSGVGGSKTNEVEPFCGRYVAKSPPYLYRETNSESKGIQLKSTVKTVCFAYQGNQIQSQVRLSYTYEDLSEELHTSATSVQVELDSREGWHYLCVDMLEKLKAKHPTLSYFWVSQIRVYKLGSAKAYYIDDVYIGREVILDNSTDVNLYRMPPAKPNEALIQSVEVTSSTAGVYDVKLVPHECGSNFPLFDKISGQIRSGGSISVSRKQTASEPISGTFSLTFKSKTKSGISYDMDNLQLTTMLESIDGIGVVTASRAGTCSKFDITVTFDSLPGDQPEFTIDKSRLSGRDVTAEVQTLDDGGLWYDPIPGDMLRTDHDDPQVMVFINDIPTECSGDCTFQWSSASTPTVTGITPTSGAPGTSVVITGTNLGATNSDNEVSIGGVMCSPTSSSTTSIQCTTGQGSYGTHLVVVEVDGKGQAIYTSGNVTFQYQMAVSGINPTTGALGGGVDLAITGYGFSSEPTVTVGGRSCEVDSATSTQIECLLPSGSAGAVDVIVTVSGNPSTSPTQFTYDASSTPTVSSITPSSTGAAGGDTLTIQGTNFGTSGTLRIGSTTVTTTSFTDTEVTAVLPSLPPETYEVFLLKGSGGAAVNGNGNIPTIDYQLQITNVFPKKASLYGGTRLTLTGQGFSTNTSLTEVKVGTTDCVIESASSTKIVCLLGDTSTVVKIDNQGVNPTWGVGYQWNPLVANARVGDIVEWTWSTPSWIHSFTHRVEQTKNETATEAASDGFKSGITGTANGRFQYRVTTAGTYSYWSGYTDYYEIVYYRGTLVVEDTTAFKRDVILKVAGQTATHNINSGVADPVDSSACPGTTSMVTGCTPPVAQSSTNNFQVSFDACYSPGITSIDKNEATTSDKISISGYGFSSTECNNEVTFGDATCTVTSSTDSLIECSIDPSNTPTVGLMQDVKVRVNNLGDALVAISGQAARTLVLKPLVSSISPSTSSLNGGALLTITGTGYQGDATNIGVSINSLDCPIQSVSYTEIVCISPPSAAGIKSLEVKVTANGLAIPAMCDIVCQLVYEPSDTPQITNIHVSPTTVDGTSTTITIRGTGFGTQTAKTEVKIGGEVCTVATVTDREITCTITNAPAGTQNIDVVISHKGKASNANNIQITSSPVISSLSPSQGSEHGGTELVIAGNGFVNGSTTVNVDGVVCDIEAITLSQITCKTRSHVAGSVDVNVISNGQSYSNQSYEYASSATPTITSVNPTAGTQGTTIVISGSNFGTVSGDNSVTTGGVACVVASETATEIRCTAGAVAIGSAPVVVDVRNKGLSNNDVNFEFELTLSNINSNTGSSAGGQTVTVTGSGFDDTTAVTICGQTCVKDTTASQTASQFVCTTPAAASAVVGTSTCDVVATVNGATQTLAGAYTYDQSLTPAITNLNPARGGTGGGTTLTITGSGFGTNKAQVSVTITGTDCPVSTVDNNEIVCVTGQHTPSQKTNVRVEISGNGIADQTNAEFFYVDVWSSPFTWGGGSPPENGSLVVIPKGNVILLDQDTNRLKMVLIKGGELIFDEVDVELFADNILIVEGGKLQIGTESQPFQHKATITGTAHLRTKELPIYGTNSLAVREGILDLHGQPVPVVWTKLDQTATAGSNQIKVQTEVTWKAGDKIVIASTGHHHSQRENEVRIINSVAGDKKTITLTENLDYEHLGVTEIISGYNLEFRAEVGLLTRNIVLRGERDRQWTEVIEACPDGFNTGEFATQTCFQGRFGEEIGSDQFGIQVMLHPPEPNKDLAIGRVSYVEFTYAGQAFRLGRYPFHFHLGGVMTSSYIKGCALHETFNRAVNIHGTYNTLVENNVIYNVMGGAFFLEDGIETGNTVQYNLAVFVRESSSLLNDDVTPASFWVTNPNNTIQHNAAAGGSHFGFWYRMHPHPEGPSRTTTVCPQKGLMGTFRNNTAHSFGWFGLWIFETFLPRENGLCGSATPTPAVYESLFAWNCDKGAESVNTGAVQFHDFILVNNKLAGYEQKKSLEGEFYTENGPLFKNGLIVGRSPTLSSNTQGCTNAGIVLPYFYRFLVDGTEFANFNEKGCAAFSFTSITGTSGPENGGFLYHTKNLIFNNVGSNNTGHFRWEFEAMILDLDGTLTGTANATVTPTSNVLPPTCSHFEKFSHGISASVCPPGMNFLRLSFNNISPTSIQYKSVLIENQHGESKGNYQKKRMTHPKGWMVTMPARHTYVLEFENAEHMTNMSFDGTLGLMEEEDFIIFSMKTVQRPDCVLLGQGVCVNETLTPLDGTVDYHGDWSFNSTTQRISYIVSKRERSVVGKRKKRAAASANIGTSLNLNFRSYKCFYEDCVVPPDPSTLPPPTTRPDDAIFWSNASTWTNDTLPVAGDSVTIEKDQWRVGDTVIPPLAELIIYGVLELDHGNATTGYRDFEISTSYIVILGGRLIIGWEDKPFMGNVHILLQGSWQTPEYFIPNDNTAIGSKVIGAFGGLDLHGKHVATPWTTLNTTANPGDNTLTVNGVVDWQVDNEIVIAPTGYRVWETETFKITAISTSGGESVLTLNESITYKHIAYVDSTVSMMAEVGLLTRNIKIEGADYSGLYTQSFGGRILVGESSHGRGFARISNVEFYHMGQEGYIEPYDPRYAVAFVDSGPVTSIKPSYIKNNAFHHGFSPAVGVYNAQNMPILDNVIHHCVWFSIQTNSDNTQIKRNMVTLMVWEGAYQDRVEPLNVRYNGAISALEATNLILEGNRVSGSERMAYNIPLQSCTTPQSDWYSDNLARSSMFGFGTLPKEKHPNSCNRISGHTIQKCFYFGVYYQNTASVVFENLTFADNQVGIYPMVNGPAAASHTFADKTITIKDVTMVGTTSTFDCSTDKIDSNDVNIALSGFARSYDMSRRIGVTYGTFGSKSNNAPEKPFANIMSYPAIKGVTILQDVTFSRYSSPCSVSDVAIATMNRNDDLIHPMKTSGLTFDNVNKDNKILIHRPNLGKINSADCVDMDCDGLKKAFLKDLDGTFLGSPGSVIPQSEWEWGGDKRRGLGDYRIPKTMQTDLNGNRISVSTLAPIKGVIRDKGCVFVSAWNAYECYTYDYEMLIIESLDSDTETRRLSPVAILGHDEDGDGILDLINGPQDHGWCSGYTCRKRLSTFQAIVATGKDYLIHFTSTTSQKLRYMLLNSVSTQAIGLSVWYSQPYRLDIYYQDNHIMPVNGRWKGDAYILDPPPVNQPMAYKPNVTSDPAGTNWFDRDSGILYFIVKGPSDITVKTVEQVIINFQYPALSVDDFYGEKIVEYLAAFFDLPPEKVRVVEIVSAQQSSGRRRKRSTGNDEIIIEVSDTPSPTLNGTASSPLTSEQLQLLYSAAVNEGQLGNFSEVLNATILGVSVAEPTVDPSNPKWSSVTTSDGYRVIVQVDHLAFNTKPVPLHEGADFTTQPKINAYDAFGNKVTDLGTTEYPWYVTASIRSGTGNPAAQLLGNTTVKFVNGWANFTNLAISYFGSGYIVDFNISSPTEGENMTLASDPMDITARPITAVMVSSTADVYEATFMSVGMELQDSVTKEKIDDIAWRSHTWTVTAEIGKPDLYNGTLDGTVSTTFDTSTSQANFYSLKLTKLGMTVIKFRITSSPADYDFYLEHFVPVKGSQHIGMVVEETSDIVLKIDADYNSIVGTEDKYVSAMFGNWFANSYPDLRFDTVAVSAGSIMVTLTVSGSNTNVNSTLYSTCTLISNGQSFTYGGSSLTLSSYMTYNGNTFYGVSCNVSPDDDDSSTSIIPIVCGVLAGVCVLAVIAVVVMWKCKVLPKTKTHDIPQWEYGTKYMGKGDIDDILFRERSFMSISAPKSTKMDSSFPHKY